MILAQQIARQYRTYLKFDLTLRPERHEKTLKKASKGPFWLATRQEGSVHFHQVEKELTKALRVQ